MRKLLVCLLATLPLGQAAANAPTDMVRLTDSERAYLSAHNPIKLCVDPDWWPFEVIDQAGQHVGIAADLLALVSERTGVRFALHRTQTWEQSVAASQARRTGAALREDHDGDGDAARRRTRRPQALSGR